MLKLKQVSDISEMSIMEVASFFFVLFTYCVNDHNEMVSTEDTDSLHIRSPRFQASVGGGGGVTLESKLKIPKSAKICLNFNFGGYTGVNFLLKMKCQDLLSGLKFQRGALWRIWTQIYCLCITDSLSHTTSMITMINQ